MRVSMPKFVIAVALLAASVSACQMKNEGYANTSTAVNTQKAAGVSSKTGKTLTASELCALPSADTSGKTTVASMHFQKNASFLRRTRAMTTQSRFVLEAESRGTWSLFGDALLLTENGITTRHAIETFVRESDNASCIRFPSLDARPEFCACDF